MKPILTILLSVICLYGFSQELKGKWQLGGSLTIQTTEGKDNFTTDTFVGESYSSQNNIFLIKPQFGYFISERVSIGGVFGYSSLRSNEDEFFLNTDIEIESKINLFYFGQFIRYHIPLSDNIFIFLQTESLFGIGNGTSSVTPQIIQDSDIDFTELSIGVRPGVLFFINDKIGFEANFGFLGYESEKLILSSDTTTTTFEDKSYGLNLDLLQIQFGIQFYF